MVRQSPARPSQPEPPSPPRAPDIDAVIAGAIETGDRTSALRIVVALAWYWQERGTGADTIALINRVIALPGDPRPGVEAAALRAATFISSVDVDPLEVVRHTSRLTEAADRAEDPLHPMLAGSMRAYLAATSGDEDEADAALSSSAEHRERVGDSAPWAVADYAGTRSASWVGPRRLRPLSVRRGHWRGG